MNIKPINLSVMAKDIAAQEGKKINLPIGQIKEVQRLVLNRLCKLDLLTLAATLEHAKRLIQISDKRVR